MSIKEITEIQVARVGSSGFNYYTIDLPNIRFPSAGTVVLDFFDIGRPGGSKERTGEDWRDLKFSFHGRFNTIDATLTQPGRATLSTGPNSIKWTLSEADEGPLTLKYTLCSSTLTAIKKGYGKKGKAIKEIKQEIKSEYVLWRQLTASSGSEGLALDHL